MVANLFRKTNLTSLLLSFVGIFLILFFFHTEQKTLSDSLFKKGGSAFGNSLLLLLALLILLYSKNRDQYLKISSFITLSFPLALLFVPSQYFRLEGLLVNILFVLAFLNLSKSERSNIVLKSVFNTALIFAVLVFLDSTFSILFLIFLLFLLSQKAGAFKLLVAITSPILIIFFLKETLNLVGSSLAWQTPWKFENMYYQISSVEWISFLGIALLFLALIFFSKGSLRKIGFSFGSIFLLALIVLGIVYGTLEKENPFNVFEILFFPLAYLIATVFESQSNAKISVIVFLLILVKGVGFFLNMY